MHCSCSLVGFRLALLGEESQWGAPLLPDKGAPPPPCRFGRSVALWGSRSGRLGLGGVGPGERRRGAEPQLSSGVEGRRGVTQRSREEQSGERRERNRWGRVGEVELLALFGP